MSRQFVSTFLEAAGAAVLTAGVFVVFGVGVGVLVGGVVLVVFGVAVGAGGDS